MRNDAIAGLLDALQLLADVVARVREFLPQHAEHAVPGGRGLRAREFAGDARPIDRASGACATSTPRSGSDRSRQRAAPRASPHASRCRRRARSARRRRAHRRRPPSPRAAAGWRRTGRSWSRRSPGRARCRRASMHVPMRSRPSLPAIQCREIMPKCRAVAGDARLPLPASPIASPQPYNRPFTAASGGNHGQTHINRRGFVVGSAAAAATLATGAGVCSRRLSLTAGDVGQSIPAGRRVDVVGRPFAAVMEPLLKQPLVIETKAGRRRRGRRAVRCQCKAGWLYAARPLCRRFPALQRSTSCSGASPNSRAPISSRSRVSPKARWCSSSTTSNPTRR